MSPPPSPLASYRIGSVPYRNALPLNQSLPPQTCLAPPSELAHQLQAHELDIALVPLAECLEHPQYTLVDGIGIGCRGPVLSVLLTSPKPLSQIQSIALDPASKTSNLLLRILIHDFLQKKHILFVSHRTSADAHLWIGDPALEQRYSHSEAYTFDLGSLWWQWTHLPFVFAVWALQGKACTPEVADALRHLAHQGLNRRAQLAQSPREWNYLTQKISYKIGPEEKTGINLFADKLLAHKILSKKPQLQWI